MISEDGAKIWQEIKKLRDRAIHDLELNIAVTGALRYNDDANNVVHIIQLRRRGVDTAPPRVLHPLGPWSRAMDAFHRLSCFGSYREGTRHTGRPAKTNTIIRIM